MKKIIRVTTVPMSLDIFCRDMLRELSEVYEVVGVTSEGPEFDRIREREGVRLIMVHMERQMSLMKDLKSLWQLYRVFRQERPDMVHSMTPKAGLLSMIAAWMARVPARVHTFTGLVWPTAKGLSRKILMMTDKITCACATHVIPEGRGVMEDLQGSITYKPMRVLGYGNVRGVDLEYWKRSGTKAGGTKAFGTKAGSTKAGGTKAGGTKAGSTKTVGTKAGGTKAFGTKDGITKAGSTKAFGTKDGITKAGGTKDGITKDGITKDEITKDTFTFLFVGRIVGDKGINEMVEAFERIKEMRNDEGVCCRLVIVGTFEEKLDPVKPETRRMMEENPAIEIVGWTTGEKLKGYYENADCFVFPSYREGFPNTVLEAGAMELPCIVTDINGSREIITKAVGTKAGSTKAGGTKAGGTKAGGTKAESTKAGSTKAGITKAGGTKAVGTKAESTKAGGTKGMKICDNGIVVPSKNADALYEAMVWMMEHPEERREMGRLARVNVEQKYEQKYVREQLYAFYREVLGE